LAQGQWLEAQAVVQTGQLNGPDDALPALEELLRAGPANARVATVERSTMPTAITPGKSFDIM